MTPKINRRNFLAGAGAATLTAFGPATRAVRANNKVVIGIIGMGGRGNGLAATFSRQPGVEIAYLCDVDRNRAEKAATSLKASPSPRTPTDFRRVLDDRSVDAVVIATCNHWHAPMTILACAAGKHVYVEKPCCHNPREGEMMVAAARKHQRMVQMGNQRRSSPLVIEAIDLARSGAVGRVYYAQAWYTNSRPTIGRGKAAPVPEGLDYALWQGPAPRRPFHDNYLHYNWHWFWHWGNGELGNNGVHTIDLCRWALAVDYSSHVTSSGGRFRYVDDQETPDTNVVSFTFADGKTIRWEGLSCNRMPKDGGADILLHGENGIIALQGGEYIVYDAAGKEVKRKSGSESDGLHAANFLEAIRGNGKLNSEIEEGHKSTLLCHIGNIAYRTGRAVRCDPKTGRITNDKEAMAFWAREYEKGWEPKV